MTEQTDICKSDIIHVALWYWHNNWEIEAAVRQAAEVYRWFSEEYDRQNHKPIERE